jgi:hypothetical protein
MAVLPTTGQTALKRILSVAYSTAIVFVAQEAAVLDALYQVRPGRRRMPAVEAIMDEDASLAAFLHVGHDDADG